MTDTGHLAPNVLSAPADQPSSPDEGQAALLMNFLVDFHAAGREPPPKPQPAPSGAPNRFAGGGVLARAAAGGVTPGLEDEDDDDELVVHAPLPVWPPPPPPVAPAATIAGAPPVGSAPAPQPDEPDGGSRGGRLRRFGRR